MPQVISNRTNVRQGPEVVREDGSKTTVSLQPKPSHVTLQEGCKVDPNWLARNPGVLNVFDK